MVRSTFVPVTRITAVLGLAILAATATAAIPTPTMSITSVSISGALPYNARSDHLKGTMSFRLNGAQKNLNAYNNATTSSVRQCVELIRRYAATLGFAGYAGNVGTGDDASKLPSVGNGIDAAKKFATASGGKFIFVGNDTTALPKPGAVMSTPLSTLSAGHTAIFGSYSNPGSATSVTIPVFEQNIPVNSFRSVVFTKQRNGVWHGTYYNEGVNNALVGWANPKD